MIDIKVVHRTVDISNIDLTSDEMKVDIGDLVQDAMTLAGKEAGICYMKDDYFTSRMVEDDRSLKRAESIVESGHHSPFDHFSIGVVITGIPKMLAMVLNSTEFYTTSEKSARYTVMHPEDPREAMLYEKWKSIYAKLISGQYPKMDSKMVEKLSMENARYVTSVFTPTVMGFTTTFRQFSYLYGWLIDFADQLDMFGDGFSKKLSASARELADAIFELTDNKVPSIKPTKIEFMPWVWGVKDSRGTVLSSIHQVCDEMYTSRYRCSLACLAQEQRHRTLHYRMGRPLDKWYVPPILDSGCKVAEFEGRDLVREWVADLWSLKDNVPQATMVEVQEFGLISNFMLKCEERLCGRAQLEIMDITKSNAEAMYKIVDTQMRMRGIDAKYHPMRYIAPNGKVVAKCAMRGVECSEPCIWKSVSGLSRLV